MYKIFNSFLRFSKIISYLIWNTVTLTLLEFTLICRHDVIVNVDITKFFQLVYLESTLHVH